MGAGTGKGIMTPPASPPHQDGRSAEKTRGMFGSEAVVKARAAVEKSWAAMQQHSGQNFDTFVEKHSLELSKKSNDTVRRLFAYAPLDARRRMMNMVMEWLVHPPDEEHLQRTAASHAHLGVTSEFLKLYANPLPDLAVETSVTVCQEEGCSMTDDDAEAMRNAWTIALNHLTGRFGLQCDECVEALHQGHDGTEGPAAFKAYEALRGQSSGGSSEDGSPQRSGGILASAVAGGVFNGWLRMSQYARSRRRAPRTAEEHNVEKHFRTRWVEIHGQYLYYFQAQGGRPIGLVDLARCRLVDTEMSNSPLPKPGPYSFALCTTTPNFPYYFVTDGDNSKEQWFQRIKGACNRFSVLRRDLSEGMRLRVWIDAHSCWAWGVCRFAGSMAAIHHMYPSPEPGAPKREKSQKEQDAQGLWVGVELDKPLGDCNGTFMGQPYFECEPMHGFFCSAHLAQTGSELDAGVLDEADCKYSPAHFDFIAVIGKGSFGRVCKVREKSSGRIFACKVLQKAAISKDTQLKNIKREKNILLETSHPYIVKLHAVFQTQGRLFLLFDFLSGGELFYHMTRPADGQAFSEPRAMLYIAEVSLAIAHLHKHDIIHRDLKAENLVLDAEGHVMLTDFGFAKTVGRDETNTTRCGTLPYMAPEILTPATDQGYSFEVDWWALGVLLFLMLTGCYPFWHRSHKTLMQQILHREIRPELFPPEPRLSLAAQSITSSLLVKNPQRRLADEGYFQAHEWFAGFDWDACRERKIKPSFVPEKAGSNMKYFDIEVSADSSAMMSKALPEEFATKFASFHDIHADYKRALRSVDSKDSEQRDDSEFIQHLNFWTQDSPADCTSPTTPQEPTDLRIDT
eukprot:TRINITY_DN594_c5_g1_i1.p1 TRINITY_DN594_c5_g1~~TRINITY_DN594_c5_g1_i1.p1  ORF type:complete len:883 (+),score=228.67 TRINITY_DN594_c5_g1_i1:96-2651(+)